MKLLPQLFHSSLGRKSVMAITGLGMLAFVAVHLAGNLRLFLGAEVLNRYAFTLHRASEVLWGVRLGLLVLAGLHIATAVSLTHTNWAARPIAYERSMRPGPSLAARTMIWSGLMVGLFVTVHVLHHSVRIQIGPTGEDFQMFRTTLADGTACHDVFRMVVASFSEPIVAGFYIIGVALLCLHLSHGIQAAFQSLGLRDGAWDGAMRKVALGVAWLVFVGYVSIPAAVWCGVGKEARSSYRCTNDTMLSFPLERSAAAPHLAATQERKD